MSVEERVEMEWLVPVRAFVRISVKGTLPTRARV
jgi:hypothetical protein